MHGRPARDPTHQIVPVLSAASSVTADVMKSESVPAVFRAALTEALQLVAGVGVSSATKHLRETAALDTVA
jgi:hypothetical protein